jgi:outer membrane protein OmpA-like peptidoglycan-associated protein
MARRYLIALALALAVAAPDTSDAQIPKLKKIKDAAKKVVSAADSARGKKSDSTAVGGADSSASATVADSAAGSVPGGAPAAKPAASAKVWENYDFVPGSRILFFTDFSEDKVGNFARRLKYVGGPVEVVARDGANVLRSTGRSQFLVRLPGPLPERFTLEIDLIAPGGGAMTESLSFEGGPEMDRGDRSANVTWNVHGAWIQGSGQNGANSPVSHPEAMVAAVTGNVTHIRVLMDGAYFKMYANERRLYNIPELAFRRDSVIRILTVGGEEEGQAVYVTSIRVAESETDVLYDALANKGRWATQGILFATGKADLQPESRPVLKEIASTLKEHADLKVLIEGHTDNVGGAASNLTLSDARAAAVKAALVADFGIAEDRVTTKGFGDTKPAAPNTTAEGRSQNRRVEVVKQ